jgi:hypothetical protein
MIRGRCETCGDVWPPVSTITVVWRHGVLSYHFDCPTCTVRVDRITTPRVAGLLIGIGCPADWDPPFRESDVERFREQLDRADWTSLLDA